MDYLKVEDLIEGGLYRIHARNAYYGIWYPANGSFLISRVKFGDNYLFEEVHWDADDHHGTVKPQEFIEQSPFMPEEVGTTLETCEQNILDYLNKFENRGPKKGWM